ncbi:MAG: class I SAM-dependent methyltransferase [Candidatus Omnitrophica bacterium]|nr:class I SAM-dependent methyltransferase [Candidatus Omnitrophota bacterium]MBU1047720.1 class I SAM-dependent methyltransferase [Candidatus Omnitrophota bacterium]MBU1767008.1 class I SAM-dependent methyltransferase [Candidatus Omnitrophota bacterium]MBU1888550.1 class I SAM-dependent methyltransferase [Candidatus Omnitrophota bacterium]
MNIKFYIALAKGIIAGYIPAGLYRLVSKGTGGTISARYSYSIWLRHLVMAYKNNLPTQPDTIAELGPGDSLGIGLAALISGVNKYYAFDVIKYADNQRNIKIFDDLIVLFRKREKIPDETEFPEIKPYLESYEFPTHILSDDHLNLMLKNDRIKSIKNALLNTGKTHSDKIQISYFVPWHNSNIIKEASVDMIYSQAVLEHVEYLEYIYETLYRWLKPGGFMSHQIDFKSHGLASEWNGHWTYSDFAWKIMRGKRSYLLNREPHSKHIELIHKAGFEIICDIQYKNKSRIQKKYLKSKFKYLSDDDLTTTGAFIQAVKKR